MLELLLAPLEAGPGDNEAFGALGRFRLFPGDQGFEFGVHLENTRQKGAAVQVGEDRAEHHLAHCLTCRVALGLAEEVGDELTFLEEELLQALALDLGMEVGLHRSEDGGEEFLVDEFGEGLGALLAEPEKEVGAGRALADYSACVLGEGFLFSLRGEELEDLSAEAGFRGSQQPQGSLLPVTGEGLGESLEDAGIFGGGNLGEDLGELARGFREELGHGGRFGARLEGLVARADLVADDQELDRLGRVDLAAALGGLLDLEGEGPEFLDFLGEVAERFQSRIEGRDLLLGMTGLAELADQALLGILRRLLKDDRFPFLGGDLEMAVCLEFLLGGVEPLLEPGGVEDRRYKHG